MYTPIQETFDTRNVATEMRSLSSASDPLVPVANSLRGLIETRRARIGVVGLGYVGFTLAIDLAQQGFETIGIEVDPYKADELNAGRSYISDVLSHSVGPLVESGRLRATTDSRALAECDCVIICVPTPLTESREPDISNIESAARAVAAQLRAGQLIVLESTTYPGTTDEVLLPAFEASGLQLDRDFFLAFSPERVDPGNKTFNRGNVTKVVGGCSPLSTSLAVALYESVVERVHSAPSARVAEASKLLENTFRAVNIGLVNELALICKKLEIDVWDVIDAAATKPFGFMPFRPGPGVGGHCIPLDPHYLAWKGRQHGLDSRFIALSEEINASMPSHVVALIGEALDDVTAAFNGADILLLGVSYKKNSEDVRESPAYPIIAQLLARGARVRYHDPHVPTLLLPKSPISTGELGIMRSRSLCRDELRQADCVVIVTDHDGIDYNLVARHARSIVDTRNVMKSRLAHDQKPRVFSL